MERTPERPVPSERYGPTRRALLIVVGGAAAVVGLGMSALFVGFLVHALSVRHFAGRELAEAVLAALAGVLICASFGVLGAARVVRGIRGRPRARSRGSVRFEAWYRRNWYPAGLGFWIVWVAAGLVSSGPGAFFSAPNGVPARLGWYALLGHLVLPLHVGAHELGHAAAGALVGFRFTSLRVGWLTVRREGRRYRLSWERPAIAGALGFHQGMPVRLGALGGRLAAHAAAGPLVTLMVALACRAGAASVAPPAGNVAHTVAWQVLQVAWWEGIVLAAMNVVPLRTRTGFMSDGAIVLHALAPATPARRALLRFHVQWTQGRRPREWGIAASELLRVADDAADERDTLLLAAMSVAIDTGDEHLATDILRRALESPASARPLMRYELELQAVMIAAFQGRTAEARERLARLGPHPGLPDYPRLAEAVVEVSEGGMAAAGAALEAWERAVEGTGMAASVRVGNQWAVERLRARLAAV